ncbi:MAG: arginine--tRNA ligase, partial [Eubacteriaceae bacterium]|nr:arginine--tRNA ligase [Eubacteriaceae bacterium]
MSILDKSRNQIVTLTADAVAKLGVEISNDEICIEVPKDKTFGEFSVNTAMKLASKLRKNPMQIAKDIVENINIDGTYIKEVDIAGAGFINFKLNQSYYCDIVKDIFTKGGNYGRCDIGKGKTVNVEFVSANPTGPVHIGNARGGAVGDVLAEILSWAGYEVSREFYVNDAGNQVAKFGASLEARYLEMFGKEFTFPEDGYTGEYIKEIAFNYAKENKKSLINVPSEERRAQLAQFGLKRNIEDMQNALNEYGIKYDNWYRESSLYENNLVEDAIEKMKATGYTYEKDDALWFEATNFGCEKDIVLIRNNSLPTYITPDIAYHINKLITRKFDIAIDVWGADHHGYVPRIKSAMEALGIDPSRLNIILMQFVRLI